MLYERETVGFISSGAFSVYKKPDLCTYLAWRKELAFVKPLFRP